MVFSWGVMFSSTDTSNHVCALEEIIRCDVCCCLEDGVAEGMDVVHSEDLWDVARFVW